MLCVCKVSGSRKDGLLLDQPVVYREAGGGHARVDAQLVVDRGQVRGHGARTDHQLLCHLGVGETLSDQPQHLDLAGGEP